LSRIRRWQRYFDDCKAAARASQPFAVNGRLTRVAGLVMEAVGLKLPVGNGCYVLMQVVNGDWKRITPARGFIC